MNLETGFYRAPNSYLSSKTNLLPKNVSQMHIFNQNQALGAYMGKNKAIIGAEGSQKHKIACYQANCEINQTF